MVRILFAISFCFISGASIGQEARKTQWVDSVFSKLSMEEKIGQKIMCLFSPKQISLADQNRLVKAGKIGGFYIMRTSVMDYARKMNELQSNAKTPMLIASDVSHSFSAKIDSVVYFYDALIQSMATDTLKRQLANEYLREMKTMGIHLDFNIEALQAENLRIFDFNEHSTKTNQELNAKVKKVLSAPIDIYIITENVDRIVKAMSKVVKHDKALTAQLNESVKKILAKKYDAGLAYNKYINTDNLLRKLHSPEANLLKQQLAQQAVIISKNDSTLLPVRKLDDKNFASVSIGLSKENEFTHYLSKYALFRHHQILDLKDTTDLIEKLRGKDIVVVGLYSAELTESLKEYLAELGKRHQLIICSFNSSIPKNFVNASAIIDGWLNEEGIPQTVAQVIFGGIDSRMEVTDSLQQSKLITVKSLGRLSYELPEAAGMDSRTLERIDRIANEAIAIGSTPGVQVLVAKDGKMVYEKSFGTLTYDKKSPYTDETIFDLASITKVSATLQAVMYMQEKGMIDIYKKASVYLPELKDSNKEDFTIKDILTHQAGLWPFLPFWAETVKDSLLWKKYYSKSESEAYPFPVSENMFASKSMKDSLWHWIIKARVRDKTTRTNYEYRYSDMGFYIMQHLAEKLIGMPLEDFLQKNIYRPMGAYTTGYLPLRKFQPEQIAPTEKDTLFRKSLLIGYVHDQGAAMHGGIAGHAGLFSNGNDLTKLGQMWLNKGSYGGIQYFKPETIEFFTAKQFETSRRGLGWDKPLLNDMNSPASMYASAKTFGHTGFTGTSIWVDPEFNLVFVFLSNRVYPDMNNNKILTANIRPRIQDVVYQSIFEYCRNHNDGLKPNELKSGLTVKP